ncbi:MAG: hypothetical protein AABY95_03945 [Pseudomonadota bacterium]
MSSSSATGCFKYFENSPTARVHTLSPPTDAPISLAQASDGSLEICVRDFSGDDTKFVAQQHVRFHAQFGYNCAKSGATIWVFFCWYLPSGQQFSFRHYYNPVEREETDLVHELIAQNKLIFIFIDKDDRAIGTWIAPNSLPDIDPNEFDHLAETYTSEQCNAFADSSEFEVAISSLTSQIVAKEIQNLSDAA